MTDIEMYNELGVSKAVYEYGENIINNLKSRFEKI